MTISVTDTATGTELTVTEVKAALDADTPLLAALQAERAGKPVATWAEFDEGLTELRHRLIDWVGEADAVLGAREVQPTSMQWAELPEEAQVPGPVIRRELPGLTSGQHRDETGDATATARPSIPQQSDPVAAYMAADDPDSEHPGRWVNMADDPYTPPRPIRIGRNPLEQAYREREARGWKPDPADYGPRPAVEQGPRNGLLARLDNWLQRAEQWWRDREARRDERMGTP